MPPSHPYTFGCISSTLTHSHLTILWPCHKEANWVIRGTMTIGSC